MNEAMLSRIEARMKALGLTKTEVSRAAGLAHSFLRDLFPEKDAPPRKKSVSYDNLKAIADVLQTTPEWLAEGRGEEELKAGAEIICAGTTGPG